MYLHTVRIEMNDTLDDTQNEKNIDNSTRPPKIGLCMGIDIKKWSLGKIWA